MKKTLLILLLILSLAAGRANAQTAEVTQLILNIEKLDELRKILEELKKGYEILFKGYNTIKELSRGNFKLHEAFLDRLLQVSPAVRGYKRIADIVSMQLRLMQEYQTAFSLFRSMGYFSADEIEYMGIVYGRVADHSLKNLDALTDVLTAKKLRMSDDQRLGAIDAIYDQMLEQLQFVRHFNANTSVLGLQRAKELGNTSVTGQLHGVTP